MAKGKQSISRASLEAPENNGNLSRNEWRKAGMTREQHKYCAKILKSLKQYKHVGPFLDSVDPVKLNVPDYFDIIKTPMDLGTVERKLNNCEYENTVDFAADVRLIFENCYLYNGLQAAISQFARDMEDIFNKSFAKMPGESIPGASSTPQPSDTKILKTSKAVEIPPQKPPAESKRPKREIRPPPSKDLPDAPSTKRKKTFKNTELNFCRAVLRELKKKQHYPYAYPFYEPVDAEKLQVPDYYTIIKHPMDLQTITNKLEKDQYDNTQQFEQDIRLMFNNCYAYNPVGSDVYRMGQQLERVFDLKWKDKPVPPPREPSPEAESIESTEDDDLEESQHHLKALQKHLAALQSEIASMQNMQKPSKSKPRKNSSTKIPKKNSKKNSTRLVREGPTKKSSKTSRIYDTTVQSSSTTFKKTAKQVPPLTEEQKQELGERIIHLSEDKMNELIELIRASGAPLENEDGSYELEIESVDANTARKIYDFVLKNTPKPKKPQTKRQRVGYFEEEEQRRIEALETQLRKFERIDETPAAENNSSDESPVYAEYTNYVSQEETSESETSDSSGSESENEASVNDQSKMLIDEASPTTTATEALPSTKSTELKPEVREAVVENYLQPFKIAEEERKAEMRRQMELMRAEDKRLEEEERKKKALEMQRETERKAAEEQKAKQERERREQIARSRDEARKARFEFVAKTEAQEFYYDQLYDAEEFWKINEKEIYEKNQKTKALLGQPLPHQ